MSAVVEHSSGEMSAHGVGGPVKASSVHFPFCPEISKYERMAKVGQGTFG